MTSAALLLSCAACGEKASGEQGSKKEASSSGEVSSSGESPKSSGADSSSDNSDGGEPDAASGEASLEPLKGGAYEEQCKEIVTMFFDAAADARRTGSNSKLVLLTNNNPNLLKTQGNPGGLLSRDRDFTSEIELENCTEIMENMYYVDVSERRAYGSGDPKQAAYIHGFNITINSAEDYRVDNIESMPDGPDLSGSGGEAAASPEPLKSGTYEDQCVEILNMFFGEASFVRDGGSPSYLMGLIGGDEALFQKLQAADGLLDGSRVFYSDQLTSRNFEKSDTADNAYSIQVDEIRLYDEEGLRGEEYGYLHTFSVTINSPTDYCITGVDSEYVDPDQLAMDPTNGTNALILSDTFECLVNEIKRSDQILSNALTNGDIQIAYSGYDYVCRFCEQWRFTDAPIYQLALERRNSIELDYQISRYG